MTEKRLFRQKHPVLTGFFILGIFFLLFWGGITFFIARLTGPANQADLFGSRESVGVIEIKGIISNSEQVLTRLVEFRRANNIKAIVVRIDSPGGAVGASQEIFTEIQRTDKVKPVVASMGSVAASGGFYAATGAGTIVANPGTLTGSLGVIIKFPNLAEIFDKIGYKNQVVKSGKLKDIGSLSRALTDEEKLLLQELIDQVHSQFIADIADSRHLDEDKVRGFADGRIFSGEQALAYGLVDELGNFQDAVMIAAKRAGLKTKYPKLIYPEEDPISLFKVFADQRIRTLFGYFSQIPALLAYEWDMGQ